MHFGEYNAVQERLVSFAAIGHVSSRVVRRRGRMMIGHLASMFAAFMAVTATPSVRAEEFALASIATLSGMPADDAAASEWNSHFEFSAGAAAGNTDNQSFTVGLTTGRESELTRTLVDALYYYNATDGDRSSSKFTAGVLQEWLLPDSPWLYFAQARFDYDEFQSWEYRVGLHAGVGYQLIDEEDLSLTLRAGAGAIREFKSMNEDWIPEALIGFDLHWQVTERQRIEAGSTFYLDLEDTGEYRNVTYARWSLLVDDESNLNLTAGIENEYQSVVDAGIKHNDFRIRAGLRFDF